MAASDMRKIPCAAAPNMEYRLILYPWIRSPYRVLSAGPAKPRFFTELPEATFSLDNNEPESKMDSDTPSL
ncbi:hypothetical protein LAZ67_23000124 [Cordylochernes scorpioides]|uniref:Uncharacterized protein n=1 Tax=Cordylochernes scorpioides TaxID=51811 RepID=A0ABY6LUH6_9ARAC|nr:hypothetical protein LAZ67_23000124 [Cordylochernes scorpioides]